MRWKRGEGRTSSVNKGTLLPAKDVTPAWERGAIVSHDGWRWEGEGRLVPRSLGRGTRSSVLHPLNTFLSHFSRSCEFESPESRTRKPESPRTKGRPALTSYSFLGVPFDAMEKGGGTYIFS